MDELRAIPLFSKAPLSLFERFTPSSIIYNFPEGVRLIDQGSVPDNLYVSLDGNVVLRFGSHAAAATVFVGWPGILLGISSIITSTPSMISAVTSSRARIAVIPRDVVLQTLLVQPDVTKSALECIGKFNIRLLQELHNRTMLSSAERLAAWLLRNRKSESTVNFVELGVSKTQLASMLGMSPESLSRSWKALSAFGVAVKKNTVSWTSNAALEELISLPPEAVPHLA